jgi:hypothetical protein
MYTYIFDKNEQDFISKRAIRRDSDGAVIPLISGNTDYKNYLVWLQSGNTPSELEVRRGFIALKISDMVAFWVGPARVMLIKNGHEQPIIVDQVFANSLYSAESQLGQGFYAHQLRNANNVPVEENGAPVYIKMSQNLLAQIKVKIEQRRGICNRAEAWHAKKMGECSYEAIGSYNYELDDGGQEIELYPLLQIAPDEIGGDVYTHIVE